MSLHSCNLGRDPTIPPSCERYITKGYFPLPACHIHSARRPSLVTKHLRTLIKAIWPWPCLLLTCILCRHTSQQHITMLPCYHCYHVAVSWCICTSCIITMLPCYHCHYVVVNWCTCTGCIVTMFRSAAVPSLTVLCCDFLTRYHVTVNWCTCTGCIVTMLPCFPLLTCCGQLVHLHWLYCRHVVVSWCTCTDCIVAMLRSAGAPALTV